MPKVEKNGLVYVLVETALVEGKPVVRREPDRQREREREKEATKTGEANDSEDNVLISSHTL